MPNPETAGSVSSAEDVLRSVEAFLQGGEQKSPEPEGKSPDSLEVYMDRVEAEKKRVKDHKVKRITVVERKTRASMGRSDERLVCQNCHQVYREPNLFLKKCMTCGSSYLRRYKANEAETGEILPFAPPPPETPAPETDAPETDAPETDAPETDAPETVIQYYDQDKAIPSFTQPEKKLKARDAAPAPPPPEAVSGADDEEVDAAGFEKSDTGWQDIVDRALDDMLASDSSLGMPGPDTDGASGWEAALKRKDPIHLRREASSFSHEYFLNKQIGDYSITKVLGRGGMGTVFKAVRLRDEKIVAVKILPPIFATDKGKVERFSKEAGSAMKLDHRNIVRYFEEGREGDIHFIAMEYVEGQSIGDLIKEQRAVKIEESLRIVKEAATGLGAAHEKGIIHRDIKPDNIMITLDERILVADFGLARDTEASNSLSNTGEIVGTPYYISPEQIDCLDVDARADIYSLGATIYHLITGKHPFKGETPMEVLLKHMNEKLVPPVDRNPLIPHSVSRLIEKMMEKNRDFRYPGVAALLADIKIIENGGVPHITLEREKEAQLTRKKKRRAVVMKPRSQFLVGAFWVALVLIVAAGVRFFALPPVDATPTLTPVRPFDPARIAWADLKAFAEEHPHRYPEILSRTENFLETYPDYPGAKLVAEIASRARSERSDRRRAWFDAQRQKAKDLQKEGRWAAAVTAWAEKPKGHPLSADMAQSLAAQRQALVKRLSQGVGMAFVPPGPVTLRDRAGRVRMVQVPAFYISFTEVSRAEYHAFVTATHASAPWKDFQQGALPVTNVTLEEARAYARWAGRRLPTEAEWTRAAAGEKGFPYPWGDVFDARRCNSQSARINDAVKVDAYPDGRSPWGLSNMAGNVCEWTQSPFEGMSGMMVVRGGSYLSPPAGVRTDTVFGARPDYRHPSLGFRCVKEYKDGKQ
jgi:serine/threonine-protein kinase